MHNNNVLFQLSVELRYWHGQRFKLLFMLFSFSVVCALFTLVLHLGDLLFKAPPPWSNPSGHLYTVARQHTDGRLAPLHRQAIDIAAQSPGVKTYSWFSVSSANFLFANNTEQPLQVLYYAASFSDVMGITAIPATETPGVWLSERYWREQLQSDPTILGKQLQHKRFPIGIPVLGILPANLNRIGPLQPDIWLPDDFQRFQTPFSEDSSTILVDRFLLAAPMYYGIISTELPLADKALTHHLQQQDLTVPGMKMAGDGAILVIHAGLNLDPPARERMLKQWQLIVVLLIGFTLVLSLNTLTIFTSRLLQQQENFRIQRTLGATLLQLMRGPMLISSLMIVGILVLSWLVLSAISLLMLQQNSYLNIVGNVGFQLNLMQWLASLLLVSVLLVTCACLPVLRLNQQPLFNRRIGHIISRGQKWLAQINLGSQLLVALTATAFILTLGWQQWQQFKNYPLDSSLLVMPVLFKGQGLNVSALVQNNLPQIRAEEAAFSLQPFNSDSTIELTDERLPGPIGVQKRVVSANYFTRLQIPLVQGSEHWQQGIVINETLARLLSEQSSTDILGSQLKLAMSGSYPIVGIVPDLPHQGISQSSTPALYLHYASASMEMNLTSRLELYFPESKQNKLQPALVNWLEQQLQEPTFSRPQTIATLLNQQDQHSRQLLGFSVIMIVLVLCTVFISLLYQIRNKMQLERHEYGVLMALGAADWQLLWRAVRQPLAAHIAIVPLALALLAWLLHPEGWLSVFNLSFSPALFIFCCSLLLLLIILAAQLRVLRLLRQVVFSLLRE